MKAFLKTPATKKSIAKRKPVCGVGINDAWYVTTPTAGGYNIKCPFYVRWTSMLVRCYSDVFQRRCPTYTDCSVCDEWRYFMAFRSWMVKQDWKDNELDKDILVEGNKVYSPDACVFVDRRTNALLIDQAASRGKYPQGVSFNKRDRKYQANVRIYGRQKTLGYYGTPEEAESAYKKVKASEIERVARLQSDHRIKEALLLRVENMRYDVLT